MTQIFSLLIALAVAQLAPGDGVPRISMAEFKTLHTANAVVVVDTRNPDAYGLGHIPGAVLLPLEGLQIWPREYEDAAVILKATMKTIVTYCA